MAMKKYSKGEVLPEKGEQPQDWTDEDQRELERESKRADEGEGC